MRAAAPRRRVAVLLAMDDARADSCVGAWSRAGLSFTSRCVHDSDELKDALRSETWSILLLDADWKHLPVAELGQYEHEVCCDLPVLVLAKRCRPELIVTCIRQGARHCMSWSESDRLGEVIEAILDRDDALREWRRADEQRHQTERIETIVTLAGGVAHDFNNLLTAISGSVELLRLTAPQESTAQKALANIEQAVAQASNLTRDLQSLSQRAPARLEPLDPQALVENTLGIIRQTLPSTIEICPALGLDGAVFVEGDRNQLQQALLQLVLNARDAMPQGGKLRLAVYTESTAAAEGGEGKERVCIEVQDTGMGMTPDVRAQIFDPFFTTKPRDRGTGLGLTIVRGIVKNHGGRLEVESAPGEGTTVTVRLPTTRRRQVCPDAAPSELVRGLGELVVITEKRAYVREIMASSLTALGYRVLTAADGESAYRLIRDTTPPPNLLVLEADSPRDGGLECLRRLREEENFTPALLTTTQSDLPLDGAAGERAIVLRKPYQMTELARLMRRMLDTPPETAEI